MIQAHDTIPRADMIRCALCKDAPCDSACPSAAPARLLRSIWFRNEQCAANRLKDANPCLNCDLPASAPVCGPARCPSAHC